MFADPQEADDMGRSGIREDVSRQDIVAAFRSAMIGHFRSHIPGTNINESTLLASDYLNHFHELVMLLEAVSSDPEGFADDLLGWRPLTYEEHFTASRQEPRDRRLSPGAHADPRALRRVGGEAPWRGRHGDRRDRHRA